jgi:hypothetical protein
MGVWLTQQAVRQGGFAALALEKQLRAQPGCIGTRLSPARTRVSHASVESHVARMGDSGSSPEPA